MTTLTMPRTVAVQITCPSWCTVDAQQHADDLWNSGGDCFHHAPDEVVADPTGHREALTEPRYHDPVTVTFTTATNPEGRETASPTFYVNHDEYSLEQLEAVIDASRRAIALYRQGGRS